MGIKGLRGMAVVAVAVLALAGSPPAEAHGQGALAVEGTAHLERFPCQPPPPFGDGPCNGSFEGTASGALGGVHEGVEWTAALNGATVTADFMHADLNNCAMGIVSGNVTVAASLTQVFGTYHDATLPRNVVGLTLQGVLQATRTGTVVQIVIVAGTVQLDLGFGELVTVATGVTGLGAGALDPSDLPVDTETCLDSGEGPPADVDMVATVTLGQLGAD